MPSATSCGGDDVDGRPVLGVHHDQAAVLRGLLHRPEDRGVVAVEHARVGGEQLEVGDALGDQLVHLGQRVVVDVAHDHVEAVVDDRVALGLGVPRVEARRAGSGPSTGRRSRRCDVVPPKAAARVPVSNVSLANVPPNGSSMCVWTSIAPGITYLPAASMVSSAVTPLAARPAPICAMVSPSTRTSASHRAVGRHDRAVGDQGAHGASSRSAASVPGRPVDVRGGHRSEAARGRAASVGARGPIRRSAVTEMRATSSATRTADGGSPGRRCDESPGYA